MTTAKALLQRAIRFYSYLVLLFHEWVLEQNVSCGKDFDLHENELVGETLFHMNGLARAKTRFKSEAKL